MKSLFAVVTLAAVALVMSTAAPAEAFRCKILNLDAVCDGSDVQLTWDAAAMCAGDTFDVYRKFGSGNWVLIASGISEEEYLDDGPTLLGAARSYKVVSDCGVGCKETYTAEVGPITCP